MKLLLLQTKITLVRTFCVLPSLSLPGFESRLYIPKPFAALIQLKYPGPLEGEGALSGAFVFNSNSPDGPLCALQNMRQWTLRDRTHPVSTSPTW